MTQHNRELDGDLRDLQKLVSDFFSLNYTEKCNKLKNQEVSIQKIQNDLNLALESERNIISHSNYLKETLNEYKDILEKSSSLEVELNKLQNEKRCIQTVLKAQQEVHNSEKATWANEKLSLLEKFNGEIDLLKKKNQEENNYIKDSFTMEIRELQRKLTSAEDELAFAKLDHEEILRQTKKIFEEKLKKKDIENEALKEELNYWRHRKCLSPTPRKGKDIKLKGILSSNNKQQSTNIINNSNQKKAIVCFKERDYNELNRYGSIETSYKQDNLVEINQKSASDINNKNNQNHLSQSITDNNKEMKSFNEKLENRNVENTDEEQNNHIMKATDNCCDISEMEQSVNYPELNITTYSSKDTNQSIINSNKLNKYNFNTTRISSNISNSMFELREPFKVDNDSRSSEQSCSSSSQETKPKAIINPIKKKVPFPVIKKKRLLNINQDFL